MSQPAKISNVLGSQVMQTQTTVSPLILFSYLQLLDFLTTVAFLVNGVVEGNPLIAYTMKASNPLVGLLLVKAVAIGLGAYCWRRGSAGLLARANFWFAVLVTWNLAALILASAS